MYQLRIPASARDAAVPLPAVRATGNWVVSSDARRTDRADVSRAADADGSSDIPARHSVCSSEHCAAHRAGSTGDSDGAADGAVWGAGHPGGEAQRAAWCAALWCSRCAGSATVSLAADSAVSAAALRAAAGAATGRAAARPTDSAATRRASAGSACCAGNACASGRSSGI